MQAKLENQEDEAWESIPFHISSTKNWYSVVNVPLDQKAGDWTFNPDPMTNYLSKREQEATFLQASDSPSLNGRN